MQIALAVIIGIAVGWLGREVTSRSFESWIRSMRSDMVTEINNALGDLSTRIKRIEAKLNEVNKP